MFNFDEVMGRIMKAEEILRTTNILEDEKSKNVLFNAVADILIDTAKMIRPKTDDDEEE